MLGLIFLRIADVRFAVQRAKPDKSSASSRRGSRVEEPGAYHAGGVLYLPAESRFDFLLKLPEGENVGQGQRGDYVSIYDFQQSVEDGATVPLFYENRTPELELVNPDLNEEIYELVEAAQLDAEQETKVSTKRAP